MSRQHSDKAALRGEQGYVWRSGQERRFRMIQEWVSLSGATILDNGCGLGTYLKAFGRFDNVRFGLELEHDRGVKALQTAAGIVSAKGEQLPFPREQFDIVFSNEVIEHVQDDAQAVAEMVRVTKPNGRILIFCPNRWHWMEQHGIYWRGEYHFGNKFFVNYLPTPIRDKLAPHVKAYTLRQLRSFYKNLPVTELYHSVIFGGYDNIYGRSPRLGTLLRNTLYAMEKTPLAVLGISHFLVLEKKG
ncbi:MAG: methyltransferase domain-containing protein [Chloroflexota bacterium]